jgi:uncharacterized lipoprotein
MTQKQLDRYNELERKANENENSMTESDWAEWEELAEIAIFESVYNH